MQKFLLLVLLIWNTPALAVETVRVGTTDIHVLPPTPEFHEVTAISETMASLAQKFVPSSNMLLGMYLPEDGYRAILAGDIPQIARYGFLQAPRATVDLIFNAQDTQRLLDAVKLEQTDFLESYRGQIQGELDRSSQSFTEEYGVNFQTSFGDTVPLGIFWQVPQARGFAHIVRYDFEADDEKLSRDIVTATIVMVVNGKAMFLYVYSPYAGDEDIVWVREIAQDWAEKILTLNAPVPVMPADSPPPVPVQENQWFNEQGLILFIMLDILVMIGVVMFLIRRKNRKTL